jgi:hypothetical protein
VPDQLRFGSNVLPEFMRGHSHLAGQSPVQFELHFIAARLQAEVLGRPPNTSPPLSYRNSSPAIAGHFSFADNLSEQFKSRYTMFIIGSGHMPGVGD